MSFGGGKKKDDAPAGLTKETAKLLDGIMAQRGISRRAAEDIKGSIASGSSEWVGHLSSGTASFQAARSKAAPLLKVPKVGQGSKQAAATTAMPPARFSGIKLAHEIARDTPAQRDMFVGGAPAPNRDKEKDRLSRAMEHGGAARVAEMDAAAASAVRAAATAAAAAARVDPKEALIDELVDEVRERREFLEAMRAAGKGGDYEAQIKGEIAERMRRLEQLGVRTRQ